MYSTIRLVETGAGKDFINQALSRNERVDQGTGNHAVDGEDGSPTSTQ